MIFLPPNPCCTTVPSPCGTHNGCDPCNASPISTNNVFYNGPTLPCTQIKNCDSVSVAFQKIDAQICLIKQQITNIYIALNNCCPTTTTTTTTIIPPSTTTTTTLFPPTTTTTTTLFPPTTTTTTTAFPPTTTTTTTIACPSCTLYSVNNSTVTTINVAYYACGGTYVTTSIVGPDIIYICACTGSVVVSPVPGVTVTNLGACSTPTTTTTTTAIPPTTTTTTTLIPPTTTTTTTLIPPTTTTTTTLIPPTTTTTTTTEVPPTTTTTTTTSFCNANGFPQNAYAALFWSQGEVDTSTTVTCDGNPVVEPSQSKSVWIAFFSDAGLTTPLAVTLNSYSITVGGTPYSIGAGNTEFAYFIDYFPYSSNPVDPFTCIPGETVFEPLPSLSANDCFTVVTEPGIGDGNMIIQRGIGDPTTNDYSADLGNCLYLPGSGTPIEVVINTGQAGPITQSNIAGYCNVTIRQLVLGQGYTITILGTANDGGAGETINIPLAISTTATSINNYFLDSNHSITVTVDEIP